MITTQLHSHQLTHPFRLGNGSIREFTDAVFVQWDNNGLTGIGEASLPPYLVESQRSVQEFVEQVMFHVKKLPETAEELHEQLNRLSTTAFSAKAALDMAWHDLKAQQTSVPLFTYLCLEKPHPQATYTMGISSLAELEKKIQEATPFANIKLKVGKETATEQIEFLRQNTSQQLMADANGAFQSVDEAVKACQTLSENGFALLEQPFPKGNLKLVEELKKQTELTLIADEDCQQTTDIKALSEVYDGVNIKLMKAGGIYPAMQMLKEANGLGLKTVLGSMTESSCAILAGLHISSLANYIDLDGPWLISNNPFEAPRLSGGRVELSDKSGLGLIAL